MKNKIKKTNRTSSKQKKKVKIDKPLVTNPDTPKDISQCKSFEFSGSGDSGIIVPDDVENKENILISDVVECESGTTSHQDFLEIDKEEEDSEQQELFEHPLVQDPKELYLNTPWAMYYMQRTQNPPIDGKNDIFEAGVTTKLVEVSTVAEFWNLMSIGGNIEGSNSNLWFSMPMKLPYRRTPQLSFFRAGIKPEWEDEGNKYGGEWRLELRDDKCNKNRIHLNAFWISTLVAVVGESMGSHDLSKHVTGVTVQRKSKEDRIKIWTNGVADIEENKKLQERIAEEWFKVMNIATSLNMVSDRLTYHSHENQIKLETERIEAEKLGVAACGDVTGRSRSVGVPYYKNTTHRNNAPHMWH